MSKVFVIPDVHLKPWMFDKAEELLSRSEYDKIVCLGDLVDDWDQEKNLRMYFSKHNKNIIVQVSIKECATGTR